MNNDDKKTIPSTIGVNFEEAEIYIDIFKQKEFISIITTSTFLSPVIHASRYAYKIIGKAEIP